MTLSGLRGLILTTCAFVGEFVGHCAPIHTAGEQAMMIMQVRAMVAETLTDWLKQSAGAGADPEALRSIAMTTSWAIWGSIFQWSRAGRKLPMAQLTDHLMTLLTPGLQPYLADVA